MSLINGNNQRLFLFGLPILILSFNTHVSKGLDTINSGQSLSWNQTITSQDGVFELGFFTPGNSQNYYIGIWYKRLPNKTVVWVANRNRPISNPSSSELKLLENGNLVLKSHSETRIWSTNSSSNLANSTIAKLLDNGNFVLRGKLDSSNLIWQSFDYPTDTWLPGGKVGYNKLRNEKQVLISWKSTENPAPSLFSLEIELNSNFVLLWNGTRLYWTSGVWDGRVFSLVPELASDSYVKNVKYVTNENESYFTYEAGVPTALPRFVLDVTGQFKQFVLRKGFPQWTWGKPPQQCEVYAFCGGYSSCNQNIPLCSCIEGFEMSSRADWELGDYSDGCLRKSPLECKNGGNDTFIVVPNTHFSFDSERLMVGNIDECQLACVRNCLCTAYAYNNGCLIWRSALFNLQKLPADDNSGIDLHLRVAASELVGTGAKAKTWKNNFWIAFGAIGGIFTLFGIFLVIFWRRRERAWPSTLKAVEDSLMVFKFHDIRNATKNFSEKLGEGGFGSVFRGTMPNSNFIAVKSLKSLKHEGEKQFRAEVSTIGMIQHINLVHLRGFCTQGTKRFLVYEYMPNGSLESHLFKKDSNVLGWKTRFKIAVGTARGLAYLHEKCRDCIIHCDVKPENILLDGEYTPKVADFGLAKLVGRDFSRVLTTMRGTIGYLAPEWISGEAITPKADIFSYGMVLFEIISGRRNIDIVNDEMNEYFPYQVANKLNNGGEVLMTLLDTRLEGNADVEELIRACKVACWCIQDDEKDRPSMGQVVQILEGVIEVGVPPLPRYIQGLMDNPMESFFFQEVSPSSTLIT